MIYRKKLIEVALPLEAISDASAYEKMPGIGPHPRGIHLWWARRPLAATRTVIFASLVDDPDDPNAPKQFAEACRKLPAKEHTAIKDTARHRLLDFVADLSDWRNIKNFSSEERLLKAARDLIRLSLGETLPPLMDPFAGGGAIPLEAQRLGLEAHASDLNPVAVMINKALIEIPPRFADMPPVNPRDQASTARGGSWKGAAGLAADVRYYGESIRDRAWERIGHLYPDYNGETVIAWIWARTVRCPNPACGVMMPLARSFELSQKKGRRAWLEPQVDPKTRHVAFTVKQGKAKAPEGTVSRQGATCLACDTPVPFDHIRAEGRSGRMGAQLMAIATEGQSGRSYYRPTCEHEQAAKVAIPNNAPDTNLPEQALGFRVQLYGMTKHQDLFTQRQLVALTTFSDLVAEAQQQIQADAIEFGMSPDNTPFRDGGIGACAYAEAVSVYLAFSIDRLADFNNSLTRWVPSNEKIMNLYARQAIPMVWDFGEANILHETVGGWMTCVEYSASCIELLKGNSRPGKSVQMDAAQLRGNEAVLISTDPPYYDNIGYADLSDFFYVWMRRMLRESFPDIFGTMLVPKAPELIAAPFRFDGDKDAADKHFEEGLEQAFTRMRTVSHPDFPMTVYYAFKQTETSDGTDQIASTGWETMLEGLIRADFSIVGTWPLRSEQKHRIISQGTNALASSIVLVCRPRPDDAPITSRREFVNALRRELPAALREMQSGNIAPVDLAQASIGPGMAVYSRYRQVLEPNGERLSVRTALQLINHELDAYLAEQEGTIDEDSRFAVAWFEQFGFKEGGFGQADVLARAKNTSVDGLAHAGVLESGAGKVRLYHWTELTPGWDPAADARPTAWEATHHLIERLNVYGEEGAARLLARMPADLAAEARGLAYRLYSICERKGWAEHARDYNALVLSWSASQEQAREFKDQYQQGRFFDD